MVRVLRASATVPRTTGGIPFRGVSLRAYRAYLGTLSWLRKRLPYAMGPVQVVGVEGFCFFVGGDLQVGVGLGEVAEQGRHGLVVLVEVVEGHREEHLQGPGLRKARDASPHDLCV